MEMCNAEGLIKSKNMKSTKKRVLLLEYIIHKKSVFTANDLYKDFSQDMDLVTIYRILNSFLERGILRAILGSNDSKEYELSCKHNPIHPHFKCKICGKLYCLETVDNKIIDNLKQRYTDFIIEDIAMHFSGVCKKCRK